MVWESPMKHAAVILILCIFTSFTLGPFAMGKEPSEKSNYLLETHRLLIKEWNQHQLLIREQSQAPIGKRGQHPYMERSYSSMFLIQDTSDYIAIDYYVKSLNCKDCTDLLIHSHIGSWIRSLQSPFRKDSILAIYQRASHGICDSLTSVVLNQASIEEWNLSKYKFIEPCLSGGSDEWRESEEYLKFAQEVTARLLHDLSSVNKMHYKK